MRIYILFKAC